MSGAGPERLRLMVVTDRRTAGDRLLPAIEAALRGGATAVQLREKDLPARDLLDLARALRLLTRAHGALLLVNDRVDVALLAEADGVHLGGGSIPVDAARRLAGGRLLAGASAHGPDEVAAAAGAGADYVVFGPVFDTPSKEGILEARGLGALREAAAASPVPVVAIGGLDAERAVRAREAGAAGVAVVRAVLASPDPGAAARAIAAATGVAGAGEAR